MSHDLRHGRYLFEKLRFYRVRQGGLEKCRINLYRFIVKHVCVVSCSMHTLRLGHGIAQQT